MRADKWLQVETYYIEMQKDNSNPFLLFSQFIAYSESRKRRNEGSYCQTGEKFYFLMYKGQTSSEGS